MKIIVCIKRVVDFNARIRVKPDKSGIETENVKMSMNPFDEIAVEEAVRLREAGTASEVIVVSCGVEKVQDTLRTAVAMGADRAILIRTDDQLQPLGIAKLLKALAEREAPQLVMLGKQSTDDDAAQTGQMLAALLDWPQGIFASGIEVQEEGVSVIREIDDGTETLSLGLPAVITADLRLNAPRYVTLPNMARARKQPVEMVTPEELGVSIVPRLEVIQVDEPAARSGVQMLPDVETLVDKLKNEAKVI
ncbi:electron transfer flavoprotein subunit beta/FixA family protein [Oxalobacter vibrioformis]|uniref:Electron transfer flavoprotein subunit beta n=1 Tax=Oxalobacter vibrioformis TaxID=933080 RepID=A0A9E9P300_9BURK|nr:electron transfer flavoprotein subunit beta/FixA family protein [Oxalobacter vibrioformis]WAW10454.1 electron transfer flavoprotein subunit beta/FixA family protein [Oxalobacter vibrioformis]